MSALHGLAQRPLVDGGGSGCRVPQPAGVPHLPVPGEGVGEVVRVDVLVGHERDVRRLMLVVALDVFLGGLLQMFLCCFYCV